MPRLRRRRLAIHASHARRLAAVLLCLTPAACERPPAAIALEALEPPVRAESAMPNLTATPDGDAVLSWLEPDGDSTYAMRVSRLADGAWSEPTVVARGRDLFVNWADFPSVLAHPNGDLLAHWLVRNGGGRSAYDIHVARSTDGGLTWGPGIVPHVDGTLTEHGFVSLWPEPGDSVGMIWLDGRDYASAPDDSGATRLMAGGLAGVTAVAAEQVVDSRICDCCQTGMAMTSRGPVVAYRDRSEDEIRDIAVVRRVDGVWTEPRIVHADGWRITACPVNGPQLAATGDTVALVWFTAATVPTVQLAISTDAGATFTAPVRVDDGNPVGRVDVVTSPDGPIVSWIENTGDGVADVRLRRLTWAGETIQTLTVNAGTAARASGFPRMHWANGSLILAWTDVASKRVRVARAVEDPR